MEPLDSQDERRYDLLTPSFVKGNEVEIGIIREFEFTPQLQRMSVVVKPLDSRNMMLYCKGSPEKVIPLCCNLPEDYDLILDSYTVKGYRVLALRFVRPSFFRVKPWTAELEILILSFAT